MRCLSIRGVARFGLCFAVAIFLGVTATNPIEAKQEKSVPVFEDGEAQVVPGFKDPADWVKHDLWVETSFDSDWDGKNDRMHVSVCRQKQTETEGLKVPASLQFTLSEHRLAHDKIIRDEQYEYHTHLSWIKPPVGAGNRAGAGHVERPKPE